MAREKKCPQCAEMVKREAVVCRFCGHTFPPETIAKPPMGIGKGCLIAVAALFGLGIFGSIVGHGPGVGNSVGNASDEAAATENRMTPDKIASDLRTTTAMAAGQALARAARNPDSLVIEGAWGSHDGKILCVAYRAQNGFGGMNREQLIYQSGRPRHGASFWNAHCRANVEDVTSTVKLGVSMSS